MKAVFAATINNADPLAALEVGELPEPQPRPFWSTVSVKAATVNHHDIWSLKGVGLAAEATPMILGTDAAGVLDEDIPVRKGLKAGDEVVLYTVIGADGAGVMPGERRTILSERYPGTMAAKTQVPSANVFAKPANLTLDEAAALGTSWLTAYSLVFASAGVKPGDTILIQGAGGGVSTAAVQLAHAAGLEVFVTSRDETKRERALALGADAAFEAGARLPRKVDAVIESVGAATWGIRCVPCAPVARLRSAVPPPATSRAPNSPACSSRTYACRATRWARARISPACCASWNMPTYTR